MAHSSGEKKCEPVGFFDVYTRCFLQTSFIDSNQAIPIYANDGFCFGRAETCRFRCADPAISNKHLRIHCIIFEEDATSDIPPLVYVEDSSTNGTYLSRASNPQQHLVEEHISPQHGSILLSHGDILRVSPNIRLHFRYSSHISYRTSTCLTSLQRREIQAFQDRYTITNQIIGSGGHGDVFVAIHKKSNRQLACKIVKVLPFKDPLWSKRTIHNPSNRRPTHSFAGYSDALGPSKVGQKRPLEDQKCRIKYDAQFREFDVLKDLDHPNVITLEKVFWTQETLYIFQALITGGDLFSYIEFKGGRLSNTEAALVVYQILNAVNYLHDRDIVHRDLKPDNILMASVADGARIILTDFGNARHIAETPNEHDLPSVKQRMFSVVGTLEYAAPEIHRKNPTMQRDQGYSKAVDMWSVGLITTAVLSGDVIFTNRVDPNYQINPAGVILELAAKCNLNVLDDPNSAWRFIGKRPKDFVRQLLILDESRRMTAAQALSHEWFTNENYVEQLEGVYQRAIRDWNPRRKVFRLVEYLDLDRCSPSLPGEVNRHSSNDTKSGYFNLPSGSLPQSGQQRGPPVDNSPKSPCPTDNNPAMAPHQVYEKLWQ